MGRFWLKTNRDYKFPMSSKAWKSLSQKFSEEPGTTGIEEAFKYNDKKKLVSFHVDDNIANPFYILDNSDNFWEAFFNSIDVERYLEANPEIQKNYQRGSKRAN